MKDIFSAPTYIVLNVPAPAAEAVRAVRRRLGPARAGMSVEITVAGSGGLGAICERQSPSLVFKAIDRIAATFQPFRARFGAATSFPETGICYYAVYPETPFLELQRLLLESPIKFNYCPFPYVPHCTLTLPPEKARGALPELPPPPEMAFMLDTVSVYSLTEELLGPKLLHRANFPGKRAEY